MKNSSFTTLIVVLLLVAGCSPSNKTEEGLLKNVYEALKDKDWETYKKLTVTYADFILKNQGTGKFEEKMGYAGGVLKPEEEQQQKDQFERAVAGGSAQIDFQQGRFLGVGSTILESSMEVLTSDQKLPFKIVSLRLDVSGTESDTKSLFPHFTVVPWDNEYRLLRLEFPLTATGK